MNDYDIWFTTLQIPNKDKAKLLKQFRSSKEIWYRIINGNMNNRIYYDNEKIKFIKETMIKDGISFLFYSDENYPKALKNYDDMPVGIFYKGNIKKLNDMNYNVGIVGARKCTNYGADVTKIISRELCGEGIGIISGMARGIDSYAHTECIENNGYTCAVLGCGANVIYPRENKSLYCKIIQNGCIISQYEPGTRPLAYNFPIRNRIISALSDLILVVEADVRSGSLITVGAALDQGKDVGAIPGSVFSKMSLGTNILIKEGAHVVTNTKDIFQILGIEVKEKKKENNKLKCEIKDDKQKNIYNVISDVPVHIDVIKRLTNIDIKELYGLLFEMQLKNQILCLSGSYYVRINSAFK